MLVRLTDDPDYVIEQVENKLVVDLPRDCRQLTAEELNVILFMVKSIEEEEK